MHIYGRDQQAFRLRRSYGERFLLHCFTFVSCVQVACFLLAIIRTSNAAGNSMDNNFFFSTSLKLKPFYLDEACGIRITYSRTFFSGVTFLLDPSNVTYIVSRCATNIRLLFTCVALHLVVCVINRTSVWAGVRDVRYHFVVLRKDLFTMWELFLMVVSFVLLWTVNSENRILVLYLRSCGYSSAGTFSQILPYTELYVSLFISLAIWVLNAIAGIFMKCKKNPRDKLLKEEIAQRELLNQMNEFNIENGVHHNREHHLTSTMGYHEGGEPVLASAATHEMPTLETQLPPRGSVAAATARTSQSVLPAAVAAAAAAPSSFSFGPSVSRPQTPTTVGLDPRGFPHVDSAADLAANVSWRSRDLTDRVASTSAVIPVVPTGTGTGTGTGSSSRFQPPPPPPSANARRSGQHDGATEDTVEL
ncbi:uncharacterized protein TM35_000481420 [Trypanosoma theileri]|uniref:Transmembrane protein n=1 Tax=Trypanosoma theileri TaxID=67003 RepID=A0A1X0NHW5_9TRYP|nr:uncharacterized protein TM35_000481420 [Trypanosoma theileri]ORC84181.1 hypothetical protein TM35_000481420 [Trypanosoma theileri]